MPQQATEIAYLPLKAGLDLEAGDAKTAWNEVLTTLAKQPGLKALFWGRQVENKDVLQLVIDWDSIDAHKTFMSSPAYQPFLELMDKHILSAPPSLFHVKFPADPSHLTPLSAPVTECISAYFDPSQSEEEYDASFATFRTKAEEITNIEAVGLAGGWSEEKHQHEGLGEGVEGKLFAAFVGWPTVEAHLEFRKTEAFEKIREYLRTGVKGIKVWHVAFTQYK
ncbi:Nn.00g048630.m01.CDS01 [Neocucurbitaria sp. VM-36]